MQNKKRKHRMRNKVKRMKLNPDVSAEVRDLSVRKTDIHLALLKAERGTFAPLINIVNEKG